MGLFTLAYERMGRLDYFHSYLLGAELMTAEHYIVGATGIGYAIVGMLQWSKGETANGMIWTGYAFAQVGLWLNIK